MLSKFPYKKDSVRMAREQGGLGEGVYVGNNNETNLKKIITSMYQPHLQANDVLIMFERTNLFC